MRRTFILWCLCVCWPASLTAKEVTVRSGEHAGFSRLVVYTKSTDTPDLIQTETGFRLSLGNTSVKFDISAVFDLIPRTRISALTSQGGGILEITVPCKCDARTEVLPTGQFVIDISDTPLPSAKSSLQDDAQTIARAENHRAQLSTLLARRGLPIAIGEAENQQVLPVRQTNNHPDQDLPATKPAATEPHPLTEQGLLEQLARAASQGLVIAPSIPALPDSEQALAPPLVEQTQSQELPTPPQSANDHLRVQTSVDRDFGGSIGTPAAAEDGTPCLPARSFAIADWGDDDERSLDFAAHKTNLLAEFDTLDQQAFKQILQHQIYLTFGAEAQAYMRTFGAGFDDDASLRLMADVMETGSSGDFARMSSQLACEGPVSLWAVLAQPRLPRDQRINTASVISEFSVLPRHLRVHLGPMVMRKFLAIGDTETAIEINGIVQRGVPIQETANALSEAQLSMATGQDTQARDTLTKIVDADDQNSVEAVLLLVASHIENQQGIPDRTLELLASLAHEHRSTERGADLAIAEIRALIHTARFTAAQTKLAGLEQFPDKSNDEHLALLEEFGSELANSGSNATFLRHAIGLPFWSEATEVTRIMLADRLLTLGFAETAKRLLLDQPMPPSREARLLIAKAALALGEVKVAMGYLSGLSSPEAMQLRAAALDEPDEQAISIAEPQDTPQIGDGNQQPETSLEKLRTLIEQSQKARAIVDAALKDAPVR